jgi:hypothetical protein
MRNIDLLRLILEAKDEGEEKKPIGGVPVGKNKLWRLRSFKVPGMKIVRHTKTIRQGGF